MNRVKGKQMPMKQEQLPFSKHMAEQAYTCNLQVLCDWCLCKHFFLCYPYVGAKAHSIYSLLAIVADMVRDISVTLAAALSAHYTI